VRGIHDLCVGVLGGRVVPKSHQVAGGLSPDGFGAGMDGGSQMFLLSMAREISSNCEKANAFRQLTMEQIVQI
jgi:hypothetical protein